MKNIIRFFLAKHFEKKQLKEMRKAKLEIGLAVYYECKNSLNFYNNNLKANPNDKHAKEGIKRTNAVIIELLTQNEELREHLKK